MSCSLERRRLWIQPHHPQLIDWYRRYVLAWELSISLEADFCAALLERALALARPEIFNTDQGVQFTSAQFQAPLLAAQVRVSMDGRGRAFDNIFVERLWRTVKYEEGYLKDYRDVPEARQGLSQYFPFYNNQRIHQALEYRTPQSVHFDAPQSPESTANGTAGGRELRLAARPPAHLTC